ncbi:hypothetical protein D3C85_1252180 [compost metagenome]
MSAKLCLNTGPAIIDPGEIDIPFHGCEIIGVTDIDIGDLGDISTLEFHDGFHHSFFDRRSPAAIFLTFKVFWRFDLTIDRCCKT